jgi:hypothetical protein
MSEILAIFSLQIFHSSQLSIAIKNMSNERGRQRDDSQSLSFKQRNQIVVTLPGKAFFHSRTEDGRDLRWSSEVR